MNTVKKLLSSEFEMSELGEPMRYMLRVQIRRDRTRKTISISQMKYVQDVLTRFGMADAHGTMTPTDCRLKARENEQHGRTASRGEIRPR